jgi:hypothetical protein
MNNGEIHLGTNLDTTTSGFIGILVGSATGLRVVAEGNGFTSQNSKLNNLGEVIYFSTFESKVMKHTPSGVTTRLFGAGDSVFGASLVGNLTIQEFNDAGDVLFLENIVVSGVSTVKLFRRLPTGVFEKVVQTGDSAPGVSGRTLSSFGGISLEQSGNVSFRSDLNPTGTNPFSGVFQKLAGQPLAKIAVDGDPAPGVGTLQILQTVTIRTTAGGVVIFNGNLIGGDADHGIFKYSGTAGTALMTTADQLPTGGRQTFRTFRVSGSGDRVGFLAQRAGGGTSIAEHVISTQTTNVLATDGDIAPMPDSPRLRIDTRNTVFLSDNGIAVFRGFAVGVGYTQAINLFGSSRQGGTFAMFSNGQQVDGFQYILPQLPPLTPSPITSNGTVVFAANRVGTNVPSILRWAQAEGLRQIVSPGDTVSGSTAVIRAISLQGIAVNNSGQVAFRARTTTGTSDPLGVFIDSAGSSPVKIVAPGDNLGAFGTFGNANLPDLNDSGEVAFMGTSTTPSVAGAFVGSAAGVSLIAKHGDSTPAGGTYSMASARPDVSINNNGDLLLRSDIAGGTANSAIFIRRGTAAPLQAVVTQGQDAPGTDGVFDTIPSGLNGLLEESIQLDNAGNVAFQNFYLDGTVRSFANWRIKPDNTIEEILVRGTVRPEFGGGAAVVSTSSISWNSNSRYPIWARVTGGTFGEGIFLSVPKVCNSTPEGNDVPVTVVDSTTGEAPLTMTFDNVDTPGETTLTTSAAGPTVPTAFQIGDPPLFFNIETTATFSGFIEICLDVSGVTFPSGGNIRLLHFENNRWKDITTSGPTGGIICGRTRSLSPFTVAEQTAPYDETPPTLSPVVDPDPVLLNGTATVTANPDDGGGSGIATQSCGELDTSSVGTKSVTCTATDNEGNTASASVSYRVVYDFAGFFQPIDNLPSLNSAKAGSAVPVKFSLAGNQGLGVLAGLPTSSQIACDTSDPGSEIEETASSGGGGLSFDPLTGQYTYVWKTNKAWKGSCRLLNVRFIDGNEYRAKFKFH